MKIDFAIITVVKLEHEAVCRAFNLSEGDRARVGSRVYWRKHLPLKNGKYYEIVVTQSLDAANVDAALVTNDAIHHWSPGALLLVGFAGAAHDGSGADDEALGDLVIGSAVYYYERGKATRKGMSPEAYMYPASPVLLNNIRAVPRWSGRILAKRPDGKKLRPKIFEGVIASGEKVIAETKSRDEITEGHRKIRAIEMEGYGFSKAAWLSLDNRPHLVFKAICDRADRDKGDDWQPYAAAVAAGFAKHFLLDGPLEPRNLPKSYKGPTATIASTAEDSRVNNGGRHFITNYTGSDSDVPQGSSLSSPLNRAIASAYTQIKKDHQAPDSEEG